MIFMDTPMTDEVRSEIADAYKAGERVPEIAERLGISVGRVYGALRAAGVDMRKGRGAHPLLASRDALSKAYPDKSVAEIAEEIGMTQSAVRAALVRHGLRPGAGWKPRARCERCGEYARGHRYLADDTDEALCDVCLLRARDDSQPGYALTRHIESAIISYGKTAEVTAVHLDDPTEVASLAGLIQESLRSGESGQFGDEATWLGCTAVLEPVEGMACQCQRGKQHPGSHTYAEGLNFAKWSLKRGSANVEALNVHDPRLPG